MFARKHITTLVMLITLSIPSSAYFDPHLPTLGLCAYNSARFCLSHDPESIVVRQIGNTVIHDAVIADHIFKIIEYAEFPEVEVIGGAPWRMTFLRNRQSFSILLEQQLDETTKWDFYLIGKTPALRVSFYASRKKDIWPLVNRVAFQLYECNPDSNNPECNRLNVLGQMVYGHLRHRDDGLATKSSAHRAFWHIVDECADHFDRECVGY